MFKDILGKTRQKVALHQHTTLSDGKKTPDEVIEIYKAHGYDAVALTDHWKHSETTVCEGMQLISGAEYNFGGSRGDIGVYHILSLFAKELPQISREDDPQTAIDKIHAAGGMAVLAHPAWSLNTPDMIMKLRDVDATEIYNAVSERGESFRPDSSVIIDMVAGMGREYPLLATDDSHYYDGIDNCMGFVMVESESSEPEALREAILQKRFYASQGPEIHLLREGEKFRVLCSPVSHIYFASNSVWTVRSKHGEGITEMDYTPNGDEKFVRAFVVDKNGRSAWSNIVML